MQSALLLLLFCITFGGTTCSDSIPRQVFVSPDYNAHEAPLVADKPLPVDFSINLRNVLDVNERQQLITLEASLRMYWKDHRLGLRPEYGHLDYVTLNPRAAHHFWIPDVFLDRARDLRVPTFFTRPASLRIYPDSTLRYSSRTNFDVACPMDFRRFPVDEQVCEVRFESFGHTSRQLRFQWRTNASNVNPNITLAQFAMEVELVDAPDTDYYDLSYPGVVLRVRLTREIGYHVVQTYVPSVVFVVLAWLSLFISAESVPGRVGMSMTTLLTLTAMFAAVRQNVPRVSYISYLDVWMVTCIIFVFACILEFTVVASCNRVGQKAVGETIEKWSRLTIPVIFLGFNLIYWPRMYYI